MAEIKNIFDVAGRSMGAQMVRLNTIASNLANAQTKTGSPDTAYRPLRAVFETVYETGFNSNSSNGNATVDVSEIIELDREPIKLFEPNNPQADADGYVYGAPVDVDEERVEMMEASRQYQNNLEVVTTLRALMMRTVNMGK